MEDADRPMTVRTLISLVSLFVALLAGCGGGEPTDSNELRVREYLQAMLVDRNFDQWSTYFDPAASINGSRLALEIMRGTADGLHHSFSDLRLEITEQIAEADSVATRFVIHGIHERPFNNQPATAKPVRLDGFVFDHLSDGRILESRMLLDVWGLSQRVAAQAEASLDQN